MPPYSSKKNVPEESRPGPGRLPRSWGVEHHGGTDSDSRDGRTDRAERRGERRKRRQEDQDDRGRRSKAKEKIKL